MTTSIKRFGSDLLGLLELPESPEIEYMADGVVNITRKYKCDKDSALFLLPKPKSPDPLGMYSRCVHSSISPIPGNIAIITAQYQGYLYLPPTIYEFQNSRMDRPIAMHPKFLDESVFPEYTKEPAAINPDQPAEGNNRTFLRFRLFNTTDHADAGKFRGVESYVVGTAQFRKISYSINPDFIQTDVGKLSVPDAGPYQSLLPDPTNGGRSWLKIEKSCINMLKGASILWTITEVWLYSIDKWMQEIYSS